MRKRSTVLTVLLCTVFLLTACQRPAEPADKVTDADSKQILPVLRISKSGHWTEPTPI